MASEELKLRQDLESARQRYEAALALMREAETVLHDIVGGHPDGDHVLRNANRTLTTASEDFRRALKNFADVVLRSSEKSGGRKIGQTDSHGN